MKAWQDWNSYRRFRKLPARDRNIVFYSESHQDWHHLQPLIDFLIDGLSRTVCHVTSEEAAPPLSGSRDGLHAFRIGSGVVRTWFFRTLKADVMVLTMLDLHNFQLKRSVHPVHYIYVFHNMGSTHMVDHENSYDHYNSVFCVGPHHMAEIRRREQLKGLPPKHLFAHGYPRLDRLIEAARAHPRKPATGAATALLAPTWGEQSILHVCGEPLIATLLSAGVRVILRPHYQTARLAPRLGQSLVDRFGEDPRFRYVDRMEESASLFELEHVDVMHRVDRSLELEVVEVEHRQDHDVGLEHLEEPGTHNAGADAEGVQPVAGAGEQGCSLLGGDVTDGPGQPVDQEVDQRLEVMPVLVAF